MLLSFYHDDAFMDRFEVSFSYRYSRAYEDGLKNRLKKEVNSFPLRLLEVDAINGISFGPVRLVLKIVSRLFLIKYLFVFYNMLLLHNLFRKTKIDLLHINNGGYPGSCSCASAVLAARMAGIRKVVYVVNNIAVPYGSFHRWIDYPLDRLVIKHVSRFVTASSFARQELENVLNLPPSQAVNIPNGINPREITEPGKEVLRRLGVVANDALIIGVVAILEARKGHIYLLKAVQLLKKNGYHNKKKLIVLIEGSGSQSETLKHFVHEEGLADSVRFIGHESNIFNFINAVDVIALPSISNEDFPNIILEAMSLGKVCIASRLSGIPEQINHMENGILVEPGDVRGLAESIILVSENNELTDYLGANAKKSFNEKYIAGTSVENYNKLYNELLEEAD